jgi:hypothetical protein
VRPNIDISYGTHGEVKDYAKEHGLDLTEAYELLLRFGLESDRTPADGD